MENWKNLERHELSCIFPDMTEVEFEQLCGDMQQHGYDKKQPVIMFEGKVLDGWNRLRAAVVEDKPPSFETYTGNYPLIEVIRRNMHRRHLTESQRAIVAAGIANRPTGKRTQQSTRGTFTNSQAALLLNVSEQSVDRAKNVISNGTPELQEAVKDGTVSVSDAAAVVKEPEHVQDEAVNSVRNGTASTVRAAARSTKKKILCPSCLTRDRKGQEAGKNCKECAALRKAAKTEKDRGANMDADPVEQEKTEEPTDSAGHVVPKKVSDPFANLEKFRTADSLCQQLQKLIDEISTETGGEQLRRCLQPTGSEEKTVNKSQHLNALKRDLKGTRPHSVCPWCRGEKTRGCKGCEGAGWITKITWDSADDAVKARLA